MPTEELADFSLPWARTIIDDPTWKPIVTFGRAEPAPNSTENSLMAWTLSRPDGIRAVSSFHRFPSSSSPGSYAEHETRMLYSLGSGIHGHSGFSHGGFIAMLIDEVSGQCVETVYGRSILTAEMSVQFKKMLPTPSIVLCRAWFEKEPVGRKIWVKSSLEDGEGTVFATGGGLFILTRPKI